MELKSNQNQLDEYRSNRLGDHLNSDSSITFSEVEWALGIINNFADNFILDDQNKNDLINALEQIRMFLKYIKESPNPASFQYESLVNPLIQIFLQIDTQNQINLYFLQVFHRLTSLLPDNKIVEYFSNNSLCEKLMDFISSKSRFNNISSRVVSHLIITRTITHFYEAQDFLRIANCIDDLSDRAYLLFTLSKVGIPNVLFFDFIQLALASIETDISESVMYCCEAISIIMNDDLPNENDKYIARLNEIFDPFLKTIKPYVSSLLLNKEVVDELTELFECLFDNCICTQFFANIEFIKTLLAASIDTLPTESNNSDIQDDCFFEAIFPFVSDIYYRCKLPVSKDLFTNVVSIAVNGTFNIRKPAFLFISNMIDLIIDETPEFFYDFVFYKLLIDMILSSTNEIMFQLLECVIKLLSATQCKFILFLNDESQSELFEDFMDGLDRVADEMEDADIDRFVQEIKTLIKRSQPRSYEYSKI